MKGRIHLVLKRSSTSDYIRSIDDLQEEFELHERASSSELVDDLSKKPVNTDTVILGPHVSDPIQTIQRIHAIDKDVPIVVLAEPEKLKVVHKAISFAPFIGDQVFSRSTDRPEEIADTLRELAQRRKQKQKYQVSVAAALAKLTTGAKEKPLKNQGQFQFNQIFDYAPIGIVTLDETCTVLACNRRGATIIGKDEVELLGENFFNLIANDQAKFLKDSFKASRSTPEQVLLKDPFGEKQYVEFTLSPLSGRTGQKGHTVIFEDVTERQEAEEERERIRQELQKAVQMRDEFVSIASHELKTPITSLVLQLELAQHILNKAPAFLGSERLRKVVGLCGNQVDRMTSLINDLLDVSRINAGRLKYEFKPCDLSKLVRDVLERYAEELARQNISLTSDIQDGLKINCDQFRIEQVILNLLSNATKYGGGRPIHIEVKGDNKSKAIVRVSDQGIGIAKEKLPYIFERYERAIDSRNISGLGLGLYISREIVHAHEGRIWAESELEKGSTFSVELPLNPEKDDHEA